MDVRVTREYEYYTIHEYDHELNKTCFKYEYLLCVMQTTNETLAARYLNRPLCLPLRSLLIMSISGDQFRYVQETVQKLGF